MRRAWAGLKSWLAAPALGGSRADPHAATRGAVLSGLAVVVAAAVSVALWDRRYALKEEVKEGPGSSKAELKAAARDAKSSAQHLKGAVEKAAPSWKGGRLHHEGER